VFDGCRGLALESVDGAVCEDITFVGYDADLKNRRCFFVSAPAARTEGRTGRTIKRILISNVTSSGTQPELCSIISGIPGHAIEDLKVSDVYLRQLAEEHVRWLTSNRRKRRRISGTDDVGPCLPLFFVRHCKNIEFSNIEIATDKTDERAAFG